MAKKLAPKKMYSWRILRIRGTPAAFIGIVDAPDEGSAINEAIKQFEITNPEHQKRLVAQRRNSSFVGSGFGERLPTVLTTVMPKKTAKELPSWRIFRTWGKTKTFLGIVVAPNERCGLNEPAAREGRQGC